MLILKDRSNPEIWNFQNKLVSLTPFSMQFQVEIQKLYLLGETEGNHRIKLKTHIDSYIWDTISQQEFKCASTEDR